MPRLHKILPYEIKLIPHNYELVVNSGTAILNDPVKYRARDHIGSCSYSASRSMHRGKVCSAG
jgi:hypothetical protein